MKIDKKVPEESYLLTCLLYILQQEDHMIKPICIAEIVCIGTVVKWYF